MLTIADRYIDRSTPRWYLLGLRRLPLTRRRAGHAPFGRARRDGYPCRSGQGDQGRGMHATCGSLRYFATLTVVVDGSLPVGSAVRAYPYPG